MPQLARLFGDHTFFLDSEGLNIVEPIEAEQNDGAGHRGQSRQLGR